MIVYESQLLAKCEKPGSKVDQARRLRMWLKRFFFSLLTHVGSYEQEESNTKEPLQICNVYVLLNFILRIESSASMGRRLWIYYLALVQAFLFRNNTKVQKKIVQIMTQNLLADM